MNEEDYVAEEKREHPWLWRREVVLNWFRGVWWWVIDDPVLDFNEGKPQMYGRRTGRDIEGPSS